MEHNFIHGPADDGIHDFKPERMVTIGQLVIGTLFAAALMALYVGFAWLEG